MNIRKTVIMIPKKINIDELIKNISFIAGEIIGYRKLGDEIEISYKDTISESELKNRFIKYVEKYMDINISQSNILYNSNEQKESYFTIEEILSSGNICEYENGMVSFSGDIAKLFDYFDGIFKGISKELKAVEERYPVLLPLGTLKNTGYLRISPQYSMYVENVKEDFTELEKISELNNVCGEMDMTGFSLSPSACFHVYERYRNSRLETNKSVTLLQSVFRNEGRFAWKEYGRLREYHVRETVFIGDEKYVCDSIDKMMKMTIDLINRLELTGSIQGAYDPFIMPQMQRFKLIQIHKELKYEARINCSPSERLSTASFNKHGQAFTKPFNIEVAGNEKTVTGCTGYGIERWVLAFLRQYGAKKSGWPIEVREWIEENGK